MISGRDSNPNGSFRYFPIRYSLARLPENNESTNFRFAASFLCRGQFFFPNSIFALLIEAVRADRDWR